MFMRMICKNCGSYNNGWCETRQIPVFPEMPMSECDYAWIDSKDNDDDEDW